MDRFLFGRAGLGFFHLPRAIFTAEVVAGDADEPVSDLYGDDQLWNLLAPENSARRGEGVPSGAAPVPGIADNGCRHLSGGGIVVESSGEAVSQA